jgi:hypothetical protein
MIQFCFFLNTKGLLDAKVDCICIIHNLLDQYRTTPVKPSSLSKEDYSLYSLSSWHLSCLAFILTESVDLNKILENRRLDSCILHRYFERKKEKKERIAKHPTLTAFSVFLFFFPFFTSQYMNINGFCNLQQRSFRMENGFGELWRWHRYRIFSSYNRKENQ